MKQRRQNIGDAKLITTQQAIDIIIQTKRIAMNMKTYDQLLINKVRQDSKNKQRQRRIDQIKCQNKNRAEDLRKNEASKLHQRITQKKKQLNAWVNQQVQYLQKNIQAKDKELFDSKLIVTRMQFDNQNKEKEIQKLNYESKNQQRQIDRLSHDVNEKVKKNVQQANVIKQQEKQIDRLSHDVNEKVKKNVQQANVIKQQEKQIDRLSNNAAFMQLRLSNFQNQQFSFNLDIREKNKRIQAYQEENYILNEELKKKQIQVQTLSNQILDIKNNFEMLKQASLDVFEYINDMAKQKKKLFEQI